MRVLSNEEMGDVSGGWFWCWGYRSSCYSYKPTYCAPKTTTTCEPVKTTTCEPVKTTTCEPKPVCNPVIEPPNEP